jgi:hypothetical protein
MLAQLGMDWLGRAYERALLRAHNAGRAPGIYPARRIDGDTLVINTRNGARCKIQEMPQLWETGHADAGDAQTEIQLGDPVGPPVMGMSIRFQEQIRDLEQTWNKSASL